MSSLRSLSGSSLTRSQLASLAVLGSGAFLTGFRQVSRSSGAQAS